MKKEGEIMKILRIDKGKAEFSTDGKGYAPIDRITKNDILSLIELVLDNAEIEMDEYDETSLANKAHQIIYQNICEKLKDLYQNRDNFQNECDAMYREALQKYGIS